MAKYVFIYHGGYPAENPEDQKRVMDAWMAWMGTLESVLVDAGNPFGPSTTLLPGGKIENNGGANPASGYSIIEAATLEEAIEKGQGCPIFADGGSVEICEAFNM